MKLLNFFLLATLTTTLACNSSDKNQSETSTKQSDKTEKEQPAFKEEYFFDFDELDHYHISIEDTEIPMHDSLSNSEKLFSSVIFGNGPSDMSFIDSLQALGFTYKHVDSTQIAEIKEIFKTRPIPEKEEMIANACEPVYRDILIFKKNHKPIGFAKLCFECEDYYIHGSSVNTEPFAQLMDYYSLAVLLGKREI